MYYDTKYSPTKNLKPLNFAKGRTFAPKIILDFDLIPNLIQGQIKLGFLVVIFNTPSPKERDYRIP